ncbi:hypothetical protein OJAV_G00074170 [Oryzias javanicus]|uniref:Ras-GEF domain-containing protein n=1 Tax=Oryzias javanicus TaxID=123683 RepID=A0A3S2Q3N7_ORYJA|nr:hypothetical protein OJAV_G00074170 [Oryzias javanicus]
MGKWEITMNPVQEWGEETEDGVVYGVTLRREPVSTSPNPEETGPCFIQYRTCKVRRLKAATLERLVNHLLDGSNQEPDFGKIFLSTYRTFTSTTKLIEMLFQRDGACSDLEDADYSKSPLLTLIQTWLDEISSAVHDGMRCQPNFCSLAGQADELLKSFQKQEEESTGGSAAAEEGSADEDSGCESPPDLGGIMDFNALSIAEQLTRMDSGLFVKVVLYQCLGSVWSQRDKENMSPTIRATITQFNAVTNQRARVIEKWIKVAQDCRRLKNFSSVKAILSALQSNAVYRLRKTWAAVCRDSMAAFDNLCDTFPDENCVLTNRELLTAEEGTQGSGENASPKISKKCPLPRQMSTSGGVVPYLGTYLSVLTMLDTALPDTLEDGLINFEKRRREFDVLSQIRVMQACCSQYNLPSHPRIAAWLQGNKLLSDQESHELSRQLEPPVDLCSPASWSQRSLTKKLSSLLSPSEGSKKVPADQISVSSSGSSGSEMEDFSSPSCSIRLQSFHGSCNNVSETFSSSSCSSATSALDSPTPSRSSSDSSTDLSSAASPAPKPFLSANHKRSVSMTALPVYNQQGADSCIIRVSVDLGQDNGNMYKSLLLTSQDKTAQVIQRALEKHHLEHMEGQNFSLTQVISQQKELVIPDKANVFYAMSTAANFDFVLRQQRKSQKKVLRASASLSRLMK